MAAPNLHRLELYLLDAVGAVDQQLTRTQWDPDEVAERLAALTAARR